PVNDAPTITGQQPLSTPEETALTVAFANLTVSDPDNTYPTGFTLSVQNGSNYTRSGNTITPAADFNGTLTVPVTVSDGTASSNLFNLSVTVTPVNDAPSITGQQPLSTPEETALTIAFANLTVTDPDNTYPTGFTLSVQNGSNYTRSGNTITPAADFNGILTLPVTVSDGVASSNAFNLSVTVTPINDAPTITGQQPLSTPEETALTIAFANLTVTDPDNSYPTGFTLSVQNGTNYTRSGNTITPAGDFNGILTVPVTVSDGAASSNVFNLSVTVTPVNDAPTITGQQPLSTPEETALTIAFANLTVTDPDNTYPTGFSLSVQNGTNYTRLGNTITPAADFNGILTVPVTVSDGTASSNVFNLSVTVTPVNDAPTITGQQPLSTPEGAALTVAFANLTVTDPDNTYPTGFTLSVQNGTNYTRSGNTITPATDFNGALTVPVTVNDGTATSNVFNLAVTVTAVNNAPSFVVGPNQSVPQGATAQAVAHFATGISPGPADESGQNLDFIVTFDHAELFAAGAGPTISPTTGDLIYTPAPDASGTSTVKVMLHDNGGTSNGGIDTSAPQTFTISVTTPAEELGTYHGVALPATGATPGADKTGLLVLTLGKKNVVTGKLRLGTFSYSFKGFIDNAGLVHFGNTPGTPKLMLDRDNLSSLELTIRVDVGGGSDQLTGVITDTSGGGAFANITADRALFTAKKKFLPPFKLVPEELLVPYTAIFDEPVAPSGVLVPHGDGFGILTVSKKGVAKLAGKLADGSKFTYANALSKDQFWPLWVPFLKGQGALAGIVRFHPVADTSDFDGQGLLWFSPGTGSFPAGWAGGTTTDLLGSTYIVTKAKPTALPNPFAPGGDGNAELTLTGGHLATPKVRKALSIETGNKVATVPLDDADQLKASIIAGKGLFKGSFVHPDTGDKTTFEGAIFQKQAFGSGFFLGTDAAGDTQAGAVTIVPDDHPLVP
ncbi:MAG: large repetitive protein, partial [Chthoniobacter sp.]|nr:large repetitive protein [Chthoniobacter sp.]